MTEEQQTPEVEVDVEVEVEEAPAAEAGAPAPAEGGVEEEMATTQQAVADLTADLQRLQAEYVNYKRRVDRDRELVRENATYAALTPIVEVLDTIDRAREHEPLEGGFKAVAEQLERIVTGLGLVKFGQSGDAFDPTVHEALSHIGTDPDVAETTCKVIAKAGYKIGDRVVRAAQVLVVDPAEPDASESEEAASAEAEPAAADQAESEQAEADPAPAGTREGSAKE